MLYPLVFWLFWRGVKEPFQSVLRGTSQGWGAFALLAVLFYVTQNLMFHYPVSVTERPVELPAMLLFLLLTPMTFYLMLLALLRQQELHESHARKQLLDMQTAALEQRMEQTELAEKRLSVQRHDLRHRFQTLHTMLERGGDKGRARLCGRFRRGAGRDEVSPLVRESGVGRDVHCLLRHGGGGGRPRGGVAGYTREAGCLRRRAVHGVRQRARKRAPRRPRAPGGAARHPLRVPPPPAAHVQRQQSHEGTVRFDDEGCPVAPEKGHGLGVASIAAYCEKHGAFCDYEAENGWFTLRMVQP